MTRKYIVTLIVLSALLLAISSATIAQTPQRAPKGPVAVEAIVNSRISYQGVLEEDGSPVTGNRDMIFHLYSDAACTTEVATIDQPGVAVASGLFSVELDVDPDNFNGQGLWLTVEVGGETLGCREVLPAPYALSLRPGAVVAGEQTDWDAIHAVNTATTGPSYGLYGETYSNKDYAIGVYGYASAASGQTYGVYGRTESSEADAAGVTGYASNISGRTYGVLGETESSGTNAAGVNGHASAGSGQTYGVRGWTESGGANAAGVYGWASASSGQTYGVYGQTDSSSNQARGVFGYATHDGSGVTYGVRGESDSTSGRGVLGRANAASGETYGVRGETASSASKAAGVYGLASTGQAYGVYGQTTSSSGRGVVGYASASSGLTYGVYGQTDSTTLYAAGVRGYAGGSTSNENYGVFGESGSTSGRGVYGHVTYATGYGVRGRVANQGDTGYGLQSDNDLFVNGACTGCTLAFLARNAGGQTLRVGDVVAVAGVGPLLKGHTKPVLDVRPATAADAAVLGVVYRRGEFFPAQTADDGDSIHPVEGDAAPGDYLLVVTGGLAQVRIAPGLQTLTPGQSLAVGDAAGLATLAGEGTNPALVFAQAMEAQPDERGLVWAMINTQ